MTTPTFGVNVSTAASTHSDPVADAVHAEALGYDFVSANDHPCGMRPNFETWTMLTWIAAKTRRIKVATRVLGVPYRAPPMVAKMAESLDRLSGGRLILGMGGGASDAEFRAFGLALPSPGQKVEGLEEAVTIVRGLWTSDRFTFRGRHHHTDGAGIAPKPAHRIPIWLGTYGPRALAVTGRVADGWVPTLELAPPEAIPAMRDTIFEAAIAIGRDPNEIELVYNLEFHVGEHEGLAPHVLSGAPDALGKKILEFKALGFTAFNFIPAGPEPRAQVEQLAQVLQGLRTRLA